MTARLVLSLSLVVGLLVAVACDRDPADPLPPCVVDTDCGSGNFCRDGFCGTLSDGGSPDGGTPACFGPGSFCSQDIDCCSPPCAPGGRCSGFVTGGTSGASGTSGTGGTGGTSGSSGTTSSGGSCQPLYGLCSFDAECCFGLTCGSTGSCR